MADIAHYWGNDLSWGPSGDLLIATGSEAVRQRVLRRLLTNPGDYLWHLDYGAGLPAKVGDTLDTAAIEGVVRRQMLKEASVAQDPLPLVTVTAIPDGASVSIQYQDADTGESVLLGFDVTR